MSDVKDQDLVQRHSYALCYLQYRGHKLSTVTFKNSPITCSKMYGKYMMI